MTAAPLPCGGRARRAASPDVSDGSSLTLARGGRKKKGNEGGSRVPRTKVGTHPSEPSGRAATHARVGTRVGGGGASADARACRAAAKPPSPAPGRPVAGPGRPRGAARPPLGSAWALPGPTKTGKPRGKNSWRTLRFPPTSERTLVLALARREMRERCIAAALAYIPPNVLAVQPCKGLWGRAHLDTGLMVAPRPLTRKALYIYLHECGHFVLHGRRRKARHVEEYEAERWAHAKMREAGLRVPRAMTVRAKAYVARMIHRAIRSGAKHINRAAAEWSGPFR